MPITTLMAVTTAAPRTVSLSEAQVWALRMTSQNPAQPSSVEVATTAASGISTSRLNQIMATPSPSVEEAVSEPDRAGRACPTVGWGARTGPVP